MYARVYRLYSLIPTPEVDGDEHRCLGSQVGQPCRDPTVYSIHLLRCKLFLFSRQDADGLVRYPLLTSLTRYMLTVACSGQSTPCPIFYPDKTKLSGFWIVSSYKPPDNPRRDGANVSDRLTQNLREYHLFVVRRTLAN